MHAGEAEEAITPQIFDLCMHAYMCNVGAALHKLYCNHVILISCTSQKLKLVS